MDRKNQNLYYIKILMGVINFIILSFLSAVFILTLNKINRDFGARNFLENITYLPNEPVTSTVLIFIVFFLLLGIIEIRRKQRKRQQVSVILYAAEILLCLIIIKFVYVNYNEIILLVIADIVTDIKDKHTRGIFFVIMGMIYLFSDYDINVYRYDIVPTIFECIPGESQYDDPRNKKYTSCIECDRIYCIHDHFDEKSDERKCKDWIVKPSASDSQYTFKRNE